MKIRNLRFQTGKTETEKSGNWKMAKAEIGNSMADVSLPTNHVPN